MLAINVVGWNVFLSVSIGSHELIIAASCGVSHNAIAPSFDRTISSDDYEFLSDIETTLIHVGPLRMFAEQRFDGLQLFRFSVVSSGDGYLSIEFPLLAVILAFGILTWISVRRRNHLPANFSAKVTSTSDDA